MKEGKIVTNSEKVRAYAEKNHEPNQESIPEFIQQWTDSWGHRQYWRSRTCERSSYGPSGAIFRAPGGKGFVRSAYIHYVPEYNMLELSTVSIDNQVRHKDGEIIRWKWAGLRVF